MERITREQIDQLKAEGRDPGLIAQMEQWLVHCQRGDALIPEIERAFAGVRLEDGIGLLEAEGIDDYAGPDEVRRLRQLDERKDWRRIPNERILNAFWAITFLDAKGFRFHAPALMIAEIKGSTSIDFLDRLLYGTYPSKDFPRLLNAAQREVIIACITWYGGSMRDDEDDDVVEEAIKRFSVSTGESA